MHYTYLNFFNLWMKDEKKVASNTGNGSCRVVEEIIQIGQIKGRNIPQFADVLEISVDEVKALDESKPA